MTACGVVLCQVTSRNKFMEMLELGVIAAYGLILLALVFDFVNGFHDTANAVATVIASGAMEEKKAIWMSAALNFLGAITTMMLGTTVAIFITKVIPKEQCSTAMIGSVLLAGLIWNLFTWWKGLPVSSTHCLLGSLVGGGFAAGGLAGINMHKVWEAVIALFVSPLVGFSICLVTAWAFHKLVMRARSRNKTAYTKALPNLQIFSSALVSFSHGSNDGQKTMGIIFLILTTQFGLAADAPMPMWVVFAAAAAIGLGTAIGGKRVIHTVARQLSHKAIDAEHGCAAEFCTAITILGGSYMGVPVSTTHVANSAVVGGCYGIHGPGHANLGKMREILLAWLFTLPVTATLAYLLYTVIQFFA